MKSSRAISSHARRRSATRAAGAATITSRAFVAQPLLHDRLDRRALQPEHLGDLGEHAGPVGDLEVQVEGRLDVADDRQRARVVSGVEAGGIIALIDVAEHGARGLRAAGARAATA